MRDYQCKGCGITSYLRNADADREFCDNCTPAPVADKGPWSVGTTPNSTYIESDDFTHDVRLEITGDFGNVNDLRLYAEGIAARLNSSANTLQRTQSHYVAEAMENARLHQRIAELEAALPGAVARYGDHNPLQFTATPSDELQRFQKLLAHWSDFMMPEFDKCIRDLEMFIATPPVATPMGGDALADRLREYANYDGASAGYTNDMYYNAAAAAAAAASAALSAQPQAGEKLADCCDAPPCTGVVSNGRYAVWCPRCQRRDCGFDIDPRRSPNLG